MQDDYVMIAMHSLNISNIFHDLKENCHKIIMPIYVCFVCMHVHTHI